MVDITVHSAKYWYKARKDYEFVDLDSNCDAGAGWIASHSPAGPVGGFIVGGLASEGADGLIFPEERR